MADDIQTLEEELNDLFTEVDRVLKSLQSLSGRDRDTVCLSFFPHIFLSTHNTPPHSPPKIVLSLPDSNLTTAGPASTASSEVCREQKQKHKKHTGE